MKTLMFIIVAMLVMVSVSEATDSGPVAPGLVNSTNFGVRDGSTFESLFGRNADVQGAE